MNSNCTCKNKRQANGYYPSGITLTSWFSGANGWALAILTTLLAVLTTCAYLTQ